MASCKGYAVFEPRGAFKLWEFPLRALGPNDVEIHVTHSGVCHSDVHFVDGEWGKDKKWPIVPGHEIIGFVTAAGEKVQHLAVVMRVGAGPQCLSCLNCRECKTQKEIYCKDAAFYGSVLPDGYVAKGGYAQKYRCHERFVHPIPEGLSSAEAAPLLCAGITTFSPLLHLGCDSTKKVAVVGVGGLGHLALQYASKMGAEVTALSTSERKRAEAMQFGATHFAVTTEPGTFKKLARQFDIILCCAPGSLDWEEYLRMLAVDGTFCNVGLPEEHFKMAVKPATLCKKRMRIMGSNVGSPAEVAKMLEFSAKHKIVPLIERLPWDRVEEARDRVRSNAARYRVVLDVDPTFVPAKSQL